MSTATSDQQDDQLKWKLKLLANATLNEREKERQRADATDYEKIHIASSCLVFSILLKSLYRITFIHILLFFSLCEIVCHALLMPFILLLEFKFQTFR